MPDKNFTFLSFSHFLWPHFFLTSFSALTHRILHVTLTTSSDEDIAYSYALTDLSGDVINLTRLPNMIGFHPRREAKSYQVMDRPDLIPGKGWETNKADPYARAASVGLVFSIWSSTCIQSLYSTQTPGRSQLC